MTTNEGCGCGRPDCDDDHEGLSDTPDLDALTQTVPDVRDIPPTPVAVVGPAAVDQMPTVWGGASSRTLPVFAAGVTGLKIVGDDYRRASLNVACVGDAATGAVILASTRSGAEMGRGFRLTPGMGVVRMTMLGEVYAASAEGGTAVVLTWWSEHWSL